MKLADSNMETRLTLDLWHPNCWAIEATERTGGGLIAHASYDSQAPETDSGAPSSVIGLFTAFGETDAEVERLLDTVRASDRTRNLMSLQERFDHCHNAPGTVRREFSLEYDADDRIYPVLLEHGFVHSAPVRIENGREEWNVRFTGERPDIDAALEDVRERAEAAVSVTSRTTSTTAPTERERRLDALTTAQRNVFEHARQTGYYRWPRGTTTREMAADIDVAKTTLLEHLRKAEAKLLDA